MRINRPMTQVEMLRWWADHMTGTAVAQDLADAATKIEQLQAAIRAYAEVEGYTYLSSQHWNVIIEALSMKGSDDERR